MVAPKCVGGRIGGIVGGSSIILGSEGEKLLVIGASIRFDVFTLVDASVGDTSTVVLSEGDCVGKFVPICAVVIILVSCV